MASDSKLFRDTVEGLGVDLAQWDHVYNDMRKDGTRRLKLEGSNVVFSLANESQWEIHDAVKKAFGKRFVSMHSVPSPCWMPCGATRKLCLVLKD